MSTLEDWRSSSTRDEVHPLVTVRPTPRSFVFNPGTTLGTRNKGRSPESTETSPETERETQERCVREGVRRSASRTGVRGSDTDIRTSTVWRTRTERQVVLFGRDRQWFVSPAGQGGPSDLITGRIRTLHSWSRLLGDGLKFRNDTEKDRHTGTRSGQWRDSKTEE